MPITITLPPPTQIVAPYTSWFVQSDFIGPLPTGSKFVVSVFQGAEPGPTTTAWTQLEPTTTTGKGFTFGLPAASSALQSHFDVALNPGAQTGVNVELQNQAGVVIDSGTAHGAWQPTTAILNRPVATPGQGGLTSEQSLQLSQTHASTFPSFSVDALLLTELSNGPVGIPVSAQLPSWVFGVIVRIANVPEDLVPDTPDGNYWVPSLAVVRIYRGADLWMRVPIHTSSKMIPLIGEGVTVAVAEVLTGLWLLNMSIQVTWRSGVTGQVFMMRTP